VEKAATVQRESYNDDDVEKEGVRGRGGKHVRQRWMKGGAREGFAGNVRKKKRSPPKKGTCKESGRKAQIFWGTSWGVGLIGRKIPDMRSPEFIG